MLRDESGAVTTLYRPTLSPTQRAARDARLALQARTKQAATLVPIQQQEPVSVPVVVSSAVERRDNLSGIDRRIHLMRISLRAIRGDLEKLAEEHGCVVEMEEDRPLRLPSSFIIRATAERYGLTINDIRAKHRNGQSTRARHVAMFLLSKMTDMKLETIGRCVNRDHTTVLYGLAKIKKAMGRDETLRNDVSAIRAALAGANNDTP